MNSSRPFELALCNEVVRELNFAAQCELAAALGYTALEVAPFTLADDPRQVSANAIASYRRQAEQASIRVSSLHWLLTAPAGLSITTPNAAVRKATLDVMEALVNMCRDLGAEVLVHGSPQQRTLSASDPSGDAERGLEAFATIASAAERAGVTYCIEPLSRKETPFINTVAEAEEIVQRVGSSALKTMLDTRAARLAEVENVETVLQRGISAGTIAHVHVNDSSGLAPGQGNDDFTGIFEVLLDTEYAGTVAVEPFEYVPDGPTAAARAVGFIDGILAGLQREGARGKIGRAG